MHDNERDAILQEREKQWGDAVSTHVRIAAVWSAIIDYDIRPHQVALMMAGLKLVRASINPVDPDSVKDARGYLGIAQEIEDARDTLLLLVQDSYGLAGDVGSKKYDTADRGAPRYASGRQVRDAQGGEPDGRTDA